MADLLDLKRKDATMGRETFNNTQDHPKAKLFAVVFGCEWGDTQCWGDIYSVAVVYTDGEGVCSKFICTYHLKNQQRQKTRN